MVSPHEQGFVRNQKGEIVILLPEGPICSGLTVTGDSGTVYSHVLVDAPDLGRPVGRLMPPAEPVSRPWGE
jgi:hypothetical protein